MLYSSSILEPQLKSTLKSIYSEKLMDSMIDIVTRQQVIGAAIEISYFSHFSLDISDAISGLEGKVERSYFVNEHFLATKSRLV